VAPGVPPDDAPVLAKLLTELQQVQRELIEQAFLRRADSVERVGDAVRRLGEVGSPAGVVERAAEELGRSSDFDRVLISSVQDGSLRPVSVWSSGEAEEELAGLEGRDMPLGYPLIEAEVAGRGEPVLVTVADSGPRALPVLSETLGWDAYAVAAIEVEGKAVGLLHADRIEDDPPLDDVDLEVAARFADGLGQAFERAILRDVLQRQRRQLQLAARWIGAQTLRLANDEAPRGAPDPREKDVDLGDVLTPRELDVLRLIARGLSNRAIAAKLTLGEGTVKYHVKNILRKMQARSRAEAVSRYMRLSSGTDGA
jgi:DNA-binding CsgD family transcriptional regulator/GAF domain-containing protein